MCARMRARDGCYGCWWRCFCRFLPFRRTTAVNAWRCERGETGKKKENEVVEWGAAPGTHLDRGALGAFGFGVAQLGGLVDDGVDVLIHQRLLGGLVIAVARFEELVGAVL